MAKLPKRRAEERCTHGPKIRFRSQAKARQAMLQHRHSAQLFIYECPYCRGWHITSWPTRTGGSR